MSVEGYQTSIADYIRGEGVPVIELDGWRTRGKAAFRPRGVVVHHDGFPASVRTSTALNTIKNGRPDVPGPLSQVWLDDDNEDTPHAGDPVAYIVAAGRANHAGQGSWRGLSGNSTVFGIEARNSGGPYDPWSEAMMDAYVRVVAALCRAGGITDTNMVCGHKEWAPRRKVDPTFDMNVFRQRVATRLSGLHVPTPTIPTPIPTPPTATPEEDDDDMVTFIETSEPATAASDVPPGGVVRLTTETWVHLTPDEWSTEMALWRITHSGQNPVPQKITRVAMQAFQRTRINVAALNAAARR